MRGRMGSINNKIENTSETKCSTNMCYPNSIHFKNNKIQPGLGKDKEESLRHKRLEEMGKEPKTQRKLNELNNSSLSSSQFES